MNAFRWAAIATLLALWSMLLAAASRADFGPLPNRQPAIEKQLCEPKTRGLYYSKYQCLKAFHRELKRLKASPIYQAHEKGFYLVDYTQAGLCSQAFWNDAEAYCDGFPEKAMKKR